MLGSLLKLLTNETTVEVMLADMVLPVPPRRMRIRQEAKIDEVDVPGRNGRVKQAVGYESADITIQLEVCDREFMGRVVELAKDRVQTLVDLFKPEQTSVPQVVPIVSELTELFQIQHVLIRNIEVAENAEYGHYDVTISLTEFVSSENEVSDALAGGASGDAADGSTTSGAGSDAGEVSAFEQGFEAGHGGAPFSPGVDGG